MKKNRKQTKALTFAASNQIPREPEGNYGQTAAASIYQEQALVSTISYLSSVADPDAVLRSAGKTRQDLKQLTYDDEIYGALETRRDAVLATPWQLEDGAGVRQRKFIENELKTLARTIMLGAWQSVPFGYSVMEAVYEKRADGTIGIAKIREKPMQWFAPNIDDELILFSPFLGLSIVDTRFKFFLTRRNPTYENPYGEALLSRLYWPWFFRTNGWRWWSKWLDRHGDPLLLAKAGKPKDLVQALTSMGIENVVAVGKDESVEVVSPHGSDVFERFDGVISAKIHKLILGQTLTSDNAKGGSNALGQVHNLVRMDKRNADIVLISQTMQNIVDALCALNPQFGAGSPRFIMQDNLGLESDRAERDATLAKTGIVKFTDQYIERAYDLEKGDFEIPSTDAQVVLPKVNPDGDSADAPADPAPKAPPAKTSASEDPTLAFSKTTLTPDQEEVETIAGDAIAKAKDPISTKDIRAAIFGATNPEDLKGRLAAVMTDADPAAFSEALERALVAAEILGYRHAAGAH